MKTLRTSIVAMALLCSFAAPVLGQPNDFLRSNPKFVDAFRAVVQPHVANTVRVQCDSRDTCLGVVVGADGWILTKAHDLKGKITCTLSNGQTLNAWLVGVHEPNDIAML